MSVEHKAVLGFGFVLLKGEIDAVWRREFPAVTHTEPRFDPRTGARLADATVVDRPGGSYLAIDGVPFVDDEDDGYASEHAALLGRLLPGAVIAEAGDLDASNWPDYLVVGPPVDLERLARLDHAETSLARKGLYTLETILRELGFDPGPGGFVAYGVTG